MIHDFTRMPLDKIDAAAAELIEQLQPTRGVPAFPSRADLEWMTAEQIDEASRAGKLDHLLNPNGDTNA